MDFANAKAYAKYNKKYFISLQSSFCQIKYFSLPVLEPKPQTLSSDEYQVNHLSTASLETLSIS